MSEHDTDAVVERLLPCPFCGGDAEVVDRPGYGHHSCIGFAPWARCTIRESYVDLIAHLRQERDELRQTIAALNAQVAMLTLKDTVAELARDPGQHDLPVSGLQRGLEDDGEGY